MFLSFIFQFCRRLVSNGENNSMVKILNGKFIQCFFVLDKITEQQQENKEQRHELICGTSSTVEVPLR